MNPVIIISITVVCSFSLILPNAYAADFQIKTNCNGDNLILTFTDKDNNTIQNVKVHTIDGIRNSPNNTFHSDELGQASIPFLDNTGLVWITKGGFNDQKINVESCDPNKVPSWIKMNAQWWIEGQIDENSFLEGLRFLIKEDILKIPKDTSGERNSVTYKSEQKIPVWVATNVEWWVHDVIDDKTILQGIQFLVINKIIDLSDNTPMEQTITRVNLKEVLPSRIVFSETVLGITPEFGSIPGGYSYAVASDDNVSCGSEGVRARYFMIEGSEHVKYETHVCLFVDNEQVKKQLRQDIENTDRGSGILPDSTIVTVESEEVGYCYFVESKRKIGVYCAIDEYLLSSTVGGNPIDKNILISMQQKTIEKFQELRQVPLDFSLLELIESGTSFVGSGNVYSLGITSTQASNVQTQNDATECPSDFPYRWDDGNCWNLPQNYETQTQLECSSDYPYEWSNGNCYNVPECTESYPYRGSDGRCYNVPECTSDFPYLWNDNQCYNLPQDYKEQLGCSSDYPYEWSNGNCYNLQECVYPYSYRWDDGQCYNQSPQLSCVNNNNYDTGYGYCCPDDMYTTGDGICRFVQACPTGYWETNYGDCCPNGTFDPGDGSCRYP
jgi:hypothetical protein